MDTSISGGLFFSMYFQDMRSLSEDLIRKGSEEKQVHREITSQKSLMCLC